MSKRYVATIKFWNYDGDPVWGVWDRELVRYVPSVSTFDAGQAREDARTLEEITDAISNA